MAPTGGHFFNDAVVNYSGDIEPIKREGAV